MPDEVELTPERPGPAPRRGFFLSLDGPDGGGKTTQAARLVASDVLANAPQSGGVFLADTPVRGAPVARMKGI